MPYPSQGIVAGDMFKSTYDPDEDGLIALAQLVAAVCSETEADGKITTHKGDASAHHTRAVDGVGFEATVAMFQANPATGTATNPQYLNDNDTGTVATFAPGAYAEVDFGKVVCIKRWRQFGSAGSSGSFKIQRYNLTTHAWVDWQGTVAYRATEDWSGFTEVTEVLTDKIRVCGLTGSGGIGEMEVIF